MTYEDFSPFLKDAENRLTVPHWTYLDSQFTEKDIRDVVINIGAEKIDGSE